MRKIFLSLILFAGISFAVSASPDRDGKHRRGTHAGMMKDLNLSAEQQEQIKTINKDFRSKLEALREDKSLTKDTRRERMKELSDSKREKVQALLTPEQQTKWNERSKKGFDGHRQGRKDFAQRGDRKRMDLNLSDEQRVQMKSFRQDFGKKMQALKEDKSLNQESRREKMKDLRSSFHKDIQSILTPEQQQKWKDRAGNDAKEYRHKGKMQGEKGKGRRGGEMSRFDSETIAELDALKQDFVKQKQAIGLSRIAPDAQKEKMRELKKKYRSDRSDIIKKARNKSDKKGEV